MPEEKYISDKRILQLAKIFKVEGRIRFEKHFFDEVGISKQSVINIRTRGQHFTAKHIEAICKKYKVNANWIYGFRNEEIFRNPSTTLPKKSAGSIKDAKSKLKIK